MASSLRGCKRGVCGFNYDDRRKLSVCHESRQISVKVLIWSAVVHFKDSNHTDRNLTLKGCAKRERRSYTDEKKVKLVVGNYVREKQKRDIRGHFLPILIEETFLGGP